MATQVEIPEWAKQRACDLVNEIDDAAFIPADCTFGPMLAFAHYIAMNEQAPVDPLLIEAREIVKATLSPDSHARCNCRAEIDAGEWDAGQKVKATLAGLRRGIELAQVAK